MKKKFLLGAIAGVALLSFAAQSIKNIGIEQTATQEEIVIEGVGITKTIKATSENNVRIEGTNNKITITGACNAIKIEGVDNVVTVDDVKSVSIEGTDNKVNYKKTSAADGKLVTATAGVNNKITKI